MKNNCNYSNYNLTDENILLNNNDENLCNYKNCNYSNFNLIDKNNLLNNNDEILCNINNLNNIDVLNNEKINDDEIYKIDFNKLLNDNNLLNDKNLLTIKNNIKLNNDNNKLDNDKLDNDKLDNDKKDNDKKDNDKKDNDKKDTLAPFLLFQNNDKIKSNKTNYVKININDENYIDLMKSAFYSKENIDYLQKSIIIKVYNDTNNNIILKKQKYESIIQIMNSFWTNDCKNLPYNYKEQIEDLNKSIIDYSSKNLIKEAYFHLNYLKDKENRKFINTPLNTKLNKNI